MVLFGGWFEIPIAIIVFVLVTYGVRSVRSKMHRPYFSASVITLVSTLIGLNALSERAGQFALDRIWRDADLFMHQAASPRVIATPQTRNLMAAVSAGSYTVEREAFVPTFRRADYLLQDERGNRYRLVLTRNAIGTPEISMRRLN